MLGELYHRRWQIEISFRDIKRTLSMDMLRTKSPEMVEKEILMFQNAYNLIRYLHGAVQAHYGIPVHKISVTGTIQVLHAHTPALLRASASRRKLEVEKERILSEIAREILPSREGGWEPRCKKNRNRSAPYMNRPRNVYKSQRQKALLKALS